MEKIKHNLGIIAIVALALTLGTALGVKEHKSHKKSDAVQTSVQPDSTKKHIESL